MLIQTPFPSGLDTLPRARCSLVNAERNRPLPPRDFGRKKVAGGCKAAPRSHAVADRSCVDLVLHSPSARPNRLRCATQDCGIDSFGGLCFRLGRWAAGIHSLLALEPVNNSTGKGVI